MEPDQEQADASQFRPYRFPRLSSPGAIWVLGAAIIGVASLAAPPGRGWLGLQALIAEAAGIVLTVFLVSHGDWTRARAFDAFCTGPNSLVLGFLGWVSLSAALSPLPDYSRTEALRHIGGAMIYFAVVHGISVRRHLGMLLLALAVATICATFGAGERLMRMDSPFISGAYQNTQLLAAFLGLILPLLVVGAVAAEWSVAQVFCQAGTIVAAAGVLLTRNRSTWIGVAVSAIVLVLLWYLIARAEKGSLRSRHLVVPIVSTLTVLALFATTFRADVISVPRLGSLLSLREDTNFQWRIGMWSKAVRMIGDRPLFGWGVGLFPLRQALYHHSAVHPVMERDIARDGANLSHNAHNTYLQMGAELGLPGLVLYLGILVGWFRHVLVRLHDPPESSSRYLLAGCIAGVAGQMFTALGSPAWELAQCSVFFWLMLGLGMALAHDDTRG